MAGLGQCRRIAAGPYRRDWRAGDWSLSLGPYASWDADADDAGFAAGPAPGPYAAPPGTPLGVAGPAMNGGQLVAGAGQAQPIGLARHHRDMRARLRNGDAGGYVTSDRYVHSGY